jgi:prepilin-type processing-associated H-X9-DG protein
MLDFYLAGSSGIPAFDGRIKRRLARVANPSQVFAFLDSSEHTINSGAFGVNPPGTSWERDWDDVPADRHNRGANLSFVDGHVESHRWRAQKPKAVSVPTTVNDLEDLRWMQARIPAP